MDASVRIRTLLFIPLISLVLSACGGGGGGGGGGAPAQTQTLTVSPQGGATTFTLGGQQINLTMPAGAVNGDVEISVAMASQAQLDTILTNSQTVAVALDLQPSGTTFNQPLQFSTTLPNTVADGDLVFGVLESNGTIEPIQNLTITDLGNGTKQVSFSVSHFSTAAIVEFADHSVNLTAPAEAVAGSSATATVTVQRGDTANSLVSVRQIDATNDTPSSSFISATNATFTDTSFGFVPSVGNLARNESTSSNLRFSCTTPDTAYSLTVRLEAIFDNTAAFNIASPDDQFLSTVTRTFTGNCVAATGGDGNNGNDNTTGGNGGDNNGNNGNNGGNDGGGNDGNNGNNGGNDGGGNDGNNGGNNGGNTGGDATFNGQIQDLITEVVLGFNFKLSGTSMGSVPNQEGNSLGWVIDAVGISTSVTQPSQAALNDCYTPITSNNAGTSAFTSTLLAQFNNCTRATAGSDNLPSGDGAASFITAGNDAPENNGQTIFSVLTGVNGANATAGDGFTFFNNNRFRQPRTLITNGVGDITGFTLGDYNTQFVVRDNANNSSDTATYRPFGGELPIDNFTDPDPVVPSVRIAVANGLNSQVAITPGSQYRSMTTFGFTSSDQDATFSGILDNQPVGTDTTQLPLFSAAALAHIQQNNLVFNKIVIVLKSDNIGFANNQIFVEVDEPPPPESAASLTTTPAALTPQPTCPLYQVNTTTRCTGGNNEALLSVNLAEEVATYNPFTGAHIDFFLQDASNGSTRTLPVIVDVGRKALQGPDNCVLYADQGQTPGSGKLLLFDGDKTHLTGDEMGNLQTSGNSPLGTSALPLLRGGVQTNRVNSYLGFDFFSADGATNWKLFVVVGADSNNDGFTDTAQLIRYDYSLVGDAVLSNPMIIASDSNGSFEDVVVIGDRVYVSHSKDGEQDTVRVFLAADGSEQAALVSNLTAPRQLAATFDGALAVVDFPLERFRIVNLQNGSTIREYVLGNGDNAGNDRLRGIAPLRNGNYLASGLSDINRSTVNRYTDRINLVGDNRSSSGVFIGRACLP